MTSRIKRDSQADLFRYPHALQLSNLFDQLRYFPEILVFEFHGLNSALNSTVKAF